MIPRNNITIKMVMTIPATLANAYVLGRFSCLSLAKGSVDSVSKKMIQHSHVMYRPCCASRLARLAISDRNSQRHKVKSIVVKKIEIESVLYK